jgi:hypothetical protein
MPPVGLNHSTAAVDFPLPFIQLSFRFDAERHNARIDPPERICDTANFSMRGTLHPVESNELFGGTDDVSLQR